MGDFLDDLADKRAKFLEGLDANQGDISLDIFEDFYPDQAHFVFELLQNAEDAGATEASFTLTEGGCALEHNGTRTFTEEDVRAITGIHNSTKSKAPDKIGKFGVGFKSVFVYTLSPLIRSGNFSFEISRLVLPKAVERDPTIGANTRFWLPFNNVNKVRDVAFSEVRQGLYELAETTLLFLPNLQRVRWHVMNAGLGEILRVEHSDHLVEIRRFVDGKLATRSFFLKFDEPVVGLERQKVAVAFCLDLLPGMRDFDLVMPLERQLRIAPADRGRVAVFFPAEKEASGLWFHLHAPFVPELSRASVKETPANHPLFKQLGGVVAKAIHKIKDQGLLSVEFLAVLPNSSDQIPARYSVIRDAIVHELNTQPLTPTHARSHAPAEQLLQGPALLKELLPDEDLEFLVVRKSDPPLWAAAAPQRNSRADRLISDLKIAKWDAEELAELLNRLASSEWNQLRNPPYYADEPDERFMSWLAAKSPEWHQGFYSFLNAEVGEAKGWAQLRKLRLVRLSDGGYGIGRESYFPSDEVHDGEDLPRVAPAILSAGRSKAQQEGARKFLEGVGVREVGETEEVGEILKRRYSKEAKEPDDKTYLNDLKRFISLVEKDGSAASMFGGAYVLQGADNLWRTPSTVFLDAPFKDTGLSSFYEKVSDADKPAALNARYESLPISRARFAKFAEAVGASTGLEVVQTRCSNNPEWAQLRSVGGDRYTSPIDRDYVLPELRAVFATPTVALSKLIWKTMANLPPYPDYLTATFQRTQRHGAHTAASQLVHDLRLVAWVPQSDGKFVRPSEAARESLPEGFAFDPGWKWLKAIQFGQEIARKSEQHRQEQALASQLGFTDRETLEDAQWFATLSAQDRQQFKESIQRSRAVQLPEFEPSRPERRAARAQKDAETAPERKTEVRARAVSVNREEAKTEAGEYLRLQYTNVEGEMFCQICKAPLPFKLNDGSDYFERVEFLPDLRRHYHQNYLALCPNHSAMFQHANGSTAEIRQRFVSLDGSELSVSIGQRSETIYFTKAHIVDLKAVVSVEDRENADAKCT